MVRGQEGDESVVRECYLDFEKIFESRGNPDRVISDSGRPHASESFSNFPHCYGFVDVTSYPRYPRASRLRKIKGLVSLSK